MKITIVAGARPNFMKIAPITRAIEAARALGKSISYRLVYTGRKDDTSLDASLFSDLDMKAPDVYLGVESSNPTSLTAGIMVAFEQELTENPAHVVLVVDDLTATMSCAIVAKKQGIKVAHLVAGTRSFDMKMPKEVNRMITDGLSDYLFTAGMVANRNLNQTGTESEKGWKAPQCAGVIHTDFEKGFIRAEVIKYDDYIKYGSEAAVKEAGKLGVYGRKNFSFTYKSR